MKNLTKFLVLCSLILLGTGYASAYYLQSLSIYYDNSATNYGDVAAIWGHSTYSQAHHLNNISNTQLWYNTWNDKWDGYTDFRFLWGGSSWTGGENKSPYERASNYATNKKYTGCVYDVNLTGAMLFKGASSDANCSLSKTSLSGGYSDLNKTQTIKVMVKKAGASSYTEEKTFTNWPATIKAKRYKLNSASSTNVTDANLTSATFTSVITSTAKIYVPTPNTGYTFKGWGTSSTATPSDASSDYSYTVSDATTIYAFFEENVTAVSFVASPTGTGSFTINEAAATSTNVTLANSVTVTAVPATGYKFVSWTMTGNATKVSENENVYTIKGDGTANGTATLTATFEQNFVYHKVTFGSNVNKGTVTATADGNPYTSGTDALENSAIVITATPTDHYRVAGWYDNQGCTGDALQTETGTGAKTYTIPQLTEDQTVYAKFVEIDYTITLTKGTGINAIKVDGTAQDNVTAHVATKTGTITAEVADGYTWKEWVITSGNITADKELTTNGIQINATSTGKLTATATEILHSVSVVSNDGNKGTVSTASVSDVGIATKSASITATPKPGYYFTGWTLPESGVTIASGSASSTTIQINATADGITITANFANRYAFRGSLNDQGNTPAGMPGWGNDALITFTEGTGVVQYTLQPNKQYKFLIYDLKNSKNRGFTSPDQTFSWNGEATFDGTYHALLNTRGTGTYTFTIAMNGDNPRVTLVGQVSHKITFGKGTGGSTITASSDNDGTITSNQYVKTGSTVTFTQTPLTGYEFKGWYTSPSGSTAVDGITTEGVMENVTADKQVYAQYKPITYNITYPASPEHYTINTEAPKTADYNTAATFTVTPDKGYLVDVTAIKTGSVTSVTLERSGNTYTISSMPAYNVTINVTAHKFKLNGWGDESSDKDFDANWEYKEELSARATYEFKLHNEASNLQNNGYFGNDGTIESTITSGWTMSDDEVTKLKLKTGIAGTYTFTYCEVEDNGVMKPQIMVKFPEVSKLTYNSTDYAFTALGDGTYMAGPIELNPEKDNEKQYNIDLLWDGSYYRNDNSSYMTAANHTNWGYVTTQETNNGLRIQVPKNEFVNTPDKYSFIWNPSTKQMTAVYPSYFRGSSTIGWGFANPMTFNASGEYTYVYTHGESADETIQVKVIDEGRYYSYDKTAKTSDEVVFSPGVSNAYKVEMVMSMPGDYVFTYNKNNHHMIVTYPDKETFPVDVYLDGVTKTTMQVGPEGGRHIEAADKPGYRFNGWELTNENTSVTVADNDKSRKSTTLYAKAAGGVVRATYSNDEFIYFKNNPGWGSVYVYFYNGDYFDETYGTGARADGKEDMRKCKGYAMTRIPNNNIWYLDYKNVDWKPGTSTIVAFADAYQNNAQWFDQCQVAYRKDFNTCMPLFSPVNYIHRYLNKHNNQQTCYYDQGHWMKYDSQESGYTLRIYSGYESATEKTSVAMVADYAGGYSFRGSVILPVGDDQPGHVYGFKLNGCNGSYFGNNGEMNSGNCSNWEFNPSSEMHNCGLKTTSKGEYIFTMSFSGGVMHVSVEYPLSNNDYRVIYSDTQEEIWNGLYYKNSTEDKLDTASFYIKNGTANAVVKLQKCTDASTSPVTWGDVQSIAVSSYETGVYNFKIAQTSSTATLSKIGAYTGNYYIRSKALDGGLEGYKSNADNRMNYTTANPAFAANGQQGYNYYKTRWITIGKDVSYTVANNYSKNISATMTGDEIIGNDTQTLPADANVRFTWNSNTNELSRAYIKGSSNAGDKFVQVYGENIYSDLECTTELTPENPGLFKDNQDWVYEYTMYAKTGATTTVKTDYNKQEQLLISNQAVFSSTKGGDVAKLRALYDFKTNRFVAAWTPPTTAITSEYSINADIMLMRNGQQQADQMTFSGEGSITGEPKTIYGAVKFDKTLMETPGTYDRSIFWISFPFDVRLNEVFGLGQYGKYWIIRYYDGAERASKGWFQETKTFWKTVSVEEREHGGTDGKGFILNANEGYNLVLDYTAVLKDLYPNGATENYLFFPSKDKLKDIPASLQQTSIDYAPLTCTITSPENRTNEDSNWRVIGVPSYADPGKLTATEGIKFYYAWNNINNTLGVDKVGSNVGTFQSMHAYMVQFAGIINWKTMTITPESPATAPLFANNEKEEYSLRLELQQEGKKVDQAYVDLTNEATEEFDLNLDITKLMYSTSQIYSFIGNDKVAANSLPVRDVVVPLCVTAAADGTYTIALPDGTEGLNVTLYDVTAGKETNMSFDGYTVHLDKGEYNNRFLLNISVPRVPTNIRNANGEWSEDGKTKKLFINDNIYLINAGRIYNASGTKVR